MHTTIVRGLALLALVTSGPLAASHNLLANPSFEHDLDGWTIATPPNTTVTWDSFGDPAGSLRITTSEPQDVTLAYQCVNGPEGFYTVTGRTYTPSTNPALLLCDVTIRGWSEPDCTGSEFFLLNDLSPTDQWVDWEATQVLGEFGIQSLGIGVRGYRLGGPGETTCYFDNLELRGPASPLAIPSLGGIGAVALAALLGVAALVALRRQRA